jgi:hypothetical protein
MAKIEKIFNPKTGKWYYPRPNSRGPKPHMRGPRPQVWITGPDPVLHKYYRAWLQQRNQAQFRKEGWDFTFEDWLAAWGDNIVHRGRGRDCMSMIRPDPMHPWSKSNYEIADRMEHSRIQGRVTQIKRKLKRG